MNYWIIVDDKHSGPYTAQQLIDSGIKPETLVWHEGLTDWIAAGSAPELAEGMRQRDMAAAQAEAQAQAQAQAEAARQQQAQQQQQYQQPYQQQQPSYQQHPVLRAVPVDLYSVVNHRHHSVLHTSWHRCRNLLDNGENSL
jgi:hypothetical protein